MFEKFGGKISASEISRKEAERQSAIEVQESMYKRFVEYKLNREQQAVIEKIIKLARGEK